MTVLLNLLRDRNNTMFNGELFDMYAYHIRGCGGSDAETSYMLLTITQDDINLLFWDLF